MRLSKLLKEVKNQIENTEPSYFFFDVLSFLWVPKLAFFFGHSLVFVFEFFLSEGLFFFVPSGEGHADSGGIVGVSSVVAFGQVDADAIGAVASDDALQVLADHTIWREFNFTGFEHGSKGHVAFGAFGVGPVVWDEDEPDLCSEVTEGVAHVLVGVEDGAAVRAKDVGNFLEDCGRSERVDGRAGPLFGEANNFFLTTRACGDDEGEAIATGSGVNGSGVGDAWDGNGSDGSCARSCFEHSGSEHGFFWVSELGFDVGAVDARVTTSDSEFVFGPDDGSHVIGRGFDDDAVACGFTPAFFDDVVEEAHRSPRGGYIDKLGTWEDAKEDGVTQVINGDSGVVGAPATDFIEDDASGPASDEGGTGLGGGDDFDFDGTPGGVPHHQCVGGGGFEYEFG